MKIGSRNEAGKTQAVLRQRWASASRNVKTRRGLRGWDADHCAKPKQNQTFLESGKCADRETPSFAFFDPRPIRVIRVWF